MLIEEGELMKLIDRLKHSLKKPEKPSVSVIPESPGPRQASAAQEHFTQGTAPSESTSQVSASQVSIESLWFALSDNPNQEDKIPLLLAICKTRGGPAAVYAALKELTDIEGSWLPQVYLGRMALEQNDYEEAAGWFRVVLDAPEPPEYALFMISADLGQYGFAQKMPELLAGVYDPGQHDIHIGLNLLQSYQDMNDSVSGTSLLKKVRRYDRPDIHDYLEGFADTFLRQSMDSASADAVSEITHEGGVIQAADADDPESVPDNLPRAIQAAVPVWSRDLPGIQAILPRTESRRRVGVYMYADTSAQGSPIPKDEYAVHPSDLAVSLPLFIGERLLFTTHYAPIALYPISRENGPKSDSLEPDVQSLFALCTRESLDFVITGTVFRDEKVYRVRSWILDKAKQSARIVSKDLPVGSFGELFNNMINDIMLLFFDKRYIKPGGRSEFPYEIPSPELMPAQLEALSYLLYQDLALHDICDSSIMPDAAKVLDICACLSGTDTKNQMYLMMLLAGMNNVRRSGSDIYTKYRHLLYDNADKIRYSPCVKATMTELNVLLQEK